MADTYSEPSTIQSVSFDVGEWVLVDYEAPEDNLFLSVAMEALVYENPQDIGVNFPLPAAGATSPIYPVVELSAAHKATRFLLTVDFLGDEGFETLRRHRAKNRTLLLQSPQGDQWWFVFGPRWEVSVRNTNDPVWRFVTFEVVEVEPLEGTGVFTASTYADTYEETY